MIKLEEFATLIQKAYANLGMKSMVPLQQLWQSFHLLKRSVTLSEFKILLKQLHDSDHARYSMDRGSSIFGRNRRYGILSDNGLLCYFRYHAKEPKP